VFVLAEHRRKGLGEELVREAVQHPDHRDVQWFLSTRDAHALYAKFGFEAASDRTMVRPPRR
jgi:predicted N-acetyltransferase YhbS